MLFLMISGSDLHVGSRVMQEHVLAPLLVMNQALSTAWVRKMTGPFPALAGLTWTQRGTRGAV